MSWAKTPPPTLNGTSLNSVSALLALSRPCWDCGVECDMKSFIAKRVISMLVNLRYLILNLLKYKENNKKICNTFDHNFKNIPLVRKVSLERYYFVLYDGALTLKMSKWHLTYFAIKLFISLCAQQKDVNMCACHKNSQCECFACSRQKGMNDETHNNIINNIINIIEGCDMWRQNLAWYESWTNKMYSF